MQELNKIVGDNLSALRKEKGLTQLSLAEKFNYTDKSVSKWEKGESLPSIEVLKQLADFYGVTLDYLTEVKHVNTKLKNHKIVPRTNKIVVTLLSIGALWLLATIFFVAFKIFTEHILWIAFIWAVPLSFVLAVIFSSIWGKKYLPIMLSLLLWTLLVAIYLQFLYANLWPIFLLGIPGQFVIILCFTVKKKKIERS